MITTTSADPDDLTTYVETAGDGTGRLTTAASELRGALDALRASEGRSAFLADVPEVDLDLTFLARRWDGLADWLAGVARAFADADGGDGGVVMLLGEEVDARAGRYTAPALEVIEREGRLIVDTGVGDDVVVLGEIGGVVHVTVNGVPHALPVGAGDEVVVRLGAGDDRVASIPIERGTTRDGLVLDGGSGDDRLAVQGGGALLRGGSGVDRLHGGGGDDRLLGGEGDDDLDGGAGDDRLIGGEGDDAIDGRTGDDWASGGEGEDLVHGELGRDRLSGGAGRDHLDGGGDGDHLDGGDDADVVAGGDGPDTIDGGAGADSVFSGPGRDLVIGGSGSDGMHVETDDVVDDATDDDIVRTHPVDLSLLDGISIAVDDAELADRILSDLVTLASTETGARLLESLRGYQLTVAGPGSVLPEGDAYAPGLAVVQYDPAGDEAGFGPAGAHRPAESLSYSPLVSLAHELIHASHDLNGTRSEGIYGGDDRNQLDTDRDGVVEPPGEPWDDDPVRNEERATVGLPIDHDEDPATPDVSAPEVIPGIVDVTENDLRDELGLASRGRY